MKNPDCITLKLVNAHEDLVRVSYSADWLAARQESPHLNNIVHPFDWTYTTQYKGQLKPDCDHYK